MEKKLKKKKTIALVAHDSRKSDLLQWCEKHKDSLKEHELVATGTTGSLISKSIGLKIHSYLSGPLGGDFQIGNGIVEEEIDMLIFFWDPLESLGHDPDVKALLRLATLYNIPMACNQTSADFFMASALMDEEYKRKLTLIDNYNKKRKSKF